MLSKNLNLVAGLFVVWSLVACSDADSGRITAQNPRGTASRASASNGAAHAMGKNDGFNWGPAPPIVPPGAQFAVVQGDPSVAGEVFTVRLLFPNGYVLAPHTHPKDEYVTVLRGTFLAGMGEDFSEAALKPTKAGGFVEMPADAAHFAKMLGITEVQVHGIGPFQLTYVHPEDDPTK